jgi:hypothetical protein
MPISLTGSLNLSGSNTLIGTKTITGSVFISGSKTIIGTNTITGSMLISGSLTAVGTITATTLVVQTITSSISSITGSTNFGSLSTNTHVFTGSINASGSGNFSGSVTATDLIISDTYANDPLIKLVTTTSGNVEVQMRTATTTYNAGIGVVTSGYDFGLFTNNTTRMTIVASSGDVLINDIAANDYAKLQVNATSGTTLGLTNTSAAADNIGANIDFWGTTGYNTLGTIGAYWDAAANTNAYLKFSTRGSGVSTEKMRITSAGNVGIGTSSPDGIFSLKSASTSSKMTLDWGGSTYGYYIQSYGAGVYDRISYIGGDHLWFTSGPTERMRITSGGYLKASNFSGYTSYFGNYHQFFQNISGDWIAEFANYNSVPYGLLIRYGAAAPRAGGNQIVYIVDTSGTVFSMTSNGNCYNLNNVYTALSDIKLKENIVDASPKLDKLLQVRIRNFNLKTDPNLKQIGVIAQEVQEIFPGLVEEIADRDVDGKLNGETSLGVKYSVFVPMLIKAIQELTARVQYLENK